MLRVDNSRPFTLPDRILKKKIIIVGAGISGLSCAEQLQKYNFKNVKILEASDRIGGRLYTFGCQRKPNKSGWNYIEMGAQRVYGGSTLYKIANDTNQIDGTSPNYCDALEKLQLIYDKTECSSISILRTYFSSRLCLPKDFKDVAKDNEFLKSFKTDDKKLNLSMKNYMKGVYHWWFGMSYECTFPSKQSELKFGYSGLLRSLVKILTKDTIISKKEVINVDWTDFQNRNYESESSENRKIKVKCRDGSLYDADHVIITVPLGYLKKNLETLFNPSLPEDKVKAIKSSYFCTANKIFLEFENPFWNLKDVYNVIWNSKLDDLFKNISEQDHSKWSKYINRFEYVHSNANMLCAWIWGEGAEIMEGLSDEDVSSCCMIILQYLLKKSLPQPTNIFRSKWFTNPLFHGSLVYDPSQSQQHNIQKIAESIILKGDQLILQFAGDATNETEQISTVEGARESGLRAAKELYVHNAVQNGLIYCENKMDCDPENDSWILT